MSCSTAPPSIVPSGHGQPVLARPLPEWSPQVILSRGVNRLIWAGLLGLLVVLAIHTRDHFESVFVGIGRLDVESGAEPGTVVLRWSGKIEAPMAARIEQAFERHRREAHTFVLALSSPGGSLDHGARVVQLLHRMAQSHTIETRVEARRRCASMCVPIYLQGQRRSAAETARFMFHEVSFSDFFSDEQVDVPDYAKASATDRLFERYFVPAGVPASWIRTVRSDMTGGRDVWKSAAQLVEERAGIVQDVF
jgi:ATP-dependent protease ClpP protease subunit